MALYLVRHDRVNADGICYGQTDIPSAVPYANSAKSLATQLPKTAHHIFSSPLERCVKLAKACYPNSVIQKDLELAEINFGAWENTPWSDIPRSEIDSWAMQPVNFQFPNGESTDQFSRRVARQYRLLRQLRGDMVVFTHAGVIRKMKSLATGRNWADCLQIEVGYLSVARLA